MPAQASLPRGGVIRSNVTEPKVASARTRDRVYVVRPSQMGQSFVIGVIARATKHREYRAWIGRQPALMAALHEFARQ